MIRGGVLVVGPSRERKPNTVRGFSGTPRSLPGLLVPLRSLRPVRASVERHREIPILQGFRGRGSWIRTNDLQYPKLPRYQAALYPDGKRELHASPAAS